MYHQTSKAELISLTGVLHLAAELTGIEKLSVPRAEFGLLRDKTAPEVTSYPDRLPKCHSRTLLGATAF